MTARFTATPFSEIQRRRSEWLDQGRVPIGGVTVLFGDPGLGKSQWTCLQAARLSRGELGEPAASLIITGEDDASRTIRPRLEAAGTTLELIHRVSGNGDGFMLPDDAPELKKLVVQTAARFVAIDPISAHLAERINSWRDSSVRAALRPLAEIAEEHSCAIVVVMHMNKSSSSQAIYRAGGSIGFIGAARSCLLFARDPDDPDGETGSRRVLVNVNNNLAPEAPTLMYEVQAITLPARGPEPEANTSRLHLTGESERNGRDVLMLSDDEERSAVDDAADFLRDELASGPRPAVELFKAARAEGHAEKTLRRAQKKLGIKPQRYGMPGKSYWSLTPGQLPWPGAENGADGQVQGNPGEDTVSGGNGSVESSTHGQSLRLAMCELSEDEQRLLEECEGLVSEGAQWVA